MTWDEELQKYFAEYEATFGEPVPMRQVGNRSNGEIIDAIKKSIEAKKDLLPVIFKCADDPGILE
jgi:hypothetical protein